MDYGELVDALRCPDFGDVPCSNHDCKYWDTYACKARVVLTDAAEAIERLQYQLEKYHERVVYLEEKCKELPEWKVTIH